MGIALNVLITLKIIVSRSFSLLKTAHAHNKTLFLFCSDLEKQGDSKTVTQYYDQKSEIKLKN